MEYKVIEGEGLFEFEKKLNDYLKKGWVLHSDLIIKKSKYRHLKTYHQAIIKN